MYFNRFDILEAYYLFGKNCHGGMFTKEYKYMGRAHNVGFKPRFYFCWDSLSENGKMIYEKLYINHFEKYSIEYLKWKKWTPRQLIKYNGRFMVEIEPAGDPNLPTKILR